MSARSTNMNRLFSFSEKNYIDIKEKELI